MLERTKGYVRQQHKKAEGTWDLDFHIYGRGTNEIFLVAEALGSTQELATSVANVTRIACIVSTYYSEWSTRTYR